MSIRNPYTVPAAGGTVNAILTTGAGCPWVIPNDYPSAIAITSPANGAGTGNATLTFTVFANKGPNLRRFSLSPDGYFDTGLINQINIIQAGTAQLVAQSIAFATLSNQAVNAPPFQINATASSGLAVTLASNTPAVCTVLGNTVTIVSSGGCAITAS